MAPSSYTVNEDAVVDLTFTGTPFADIDTNSLTVTLSVADGSINATTGGNVTVAGTGTDRTFSGTAADLNAFFTTAGNITYQGAAHVNGSRTLTVTVNDGQNANNTATATSTINITAVNDAPVASGSATLAAVAEDTTNPAGATVLSLFSGNFNDSKDAVTNGSSANTLAGVAITANTANANTQGKWQYTDANNAWVDIPTTASLSGAIYVRADAKIRFLPAANFNGSPPALTVKLVDNSPATIGTVNSGITTDTSNPANTQFSTSTITLGTSITAVNDTPTISAPTSFTVNEDVAGNLLFTGTPFADVDTNSLTVTLSVADGSINATTGGNVTVGGTATVRTFTGTVADLNAFFITAGKITYQGAAHVNGSRTLTVTVNDGQSANNTATTTSTINITAVNDTPTGTVTVSGSVSVGSLLTANNSLADIDVLGTISYKWEVLNGSIWTSVGTATTYTPVAGDVGKFLRLTASYTDGGGTAESFSSSAFTIAPIDTQPPMVKAVNIYSNALVLTFDELLAGSTGVPAASAFTLNKYNSANTATNIAITSLEHPINAQTNAPINDQFKLNYANQTLLDSANPYIKLSYADPTTGNDTNALQDSTGNDMPSFNLFVYNLNANTATGTNAVDYIMGGAGNDNITGGLGNDVLWGLDTFTANAVTDSDSFVWALGDAGTTGAVDIVKDFVAWNGTAGDKLNITSLLAGGYNTSTSVLSQWVTVTTGQTLPGSATANSTKIVIDVDGSGAGNVTQTIWLEGVTLSTTDAAALKNSGVLIA
jgi:hypothetical protein